MCVPRRRRDLALAALLALTFAATPAGAGDEAPPETVGEAARDAGHAARDAARDVGHATRDVVKDIGHATRDATREAGHAVRDTVKDVGHAVSDAVKGDAQTSDKKED